MLLENFDIVVVGAGPAGSTFARKTAAAGIKTAVLEKRQAIGVPVRCGEGLAEEYLKRHKITERHFVCQDINGSRFFSPDGNVVSSSSKKITGRIIDRKIFDKHLAILAASEGATVMTRTRVTGVSKSKEGYIVHAQRLGKPVDYHAKLLVAADGSESRVAKYLGINTTCIPSDLCSCAQVELAGIKLDKPNSIDFYLGTDVAPGGYIWVFPKGKDRANVGVGIRANFEPAASFYLDKFLKKMGWENASIVQDTCGIIQVGSPLRELMADRFMIVGTAARQVNSIHGGGMGDAMNAASVAADVAIKAFKQNKFSKEFLSEYPRLWHKQYGGKLLGVLKIRHAFDHMDNEDLNYFFKAFNKEAFGEAQEGNLGKLVKVFTGRPQMIKFVRYLI